MTQTYVHGYDAGEAQRLQDQADLLVELQPRAGGNALIGRTLYPLLAQAGFPEVRVSPRMVYVDDSRPHLVEGFTRRTFTAMVRGVRAAAIASELATPAAFDRGIAGLERTAEGGGVFCYTFFKAVATGNGDGA